MKRNLTALTVFLLSLFTTPSFAVRDGLDNDSCLKRLWLGRPGSVNLAMHGLLDKFSTRSSDDPAAQTAAVIAYNNLAQSLEGFSGQFLKALHAQGKENIVFSSYNLMQLLLVLANNADSAPQIEFVKALDSFRGFKRERPLTAELARELIHDATRAFRYSMEQLKVELGEGNVVELATGLFSTQDDFSFSPEDLAVAQKAFGALIQNKASMASINAWVSEKTRGLIPELFKIEPKPAAIVTTLYLKGVWEQAFDENRTKERPFYSRDGSTSSTVSMMSLKASGLRFVETPEYTAASVPFKSGRLVIDVIVPNYDVAEQGARTQFGSTTKHAATLEKLGSNLREVLAGLESAPKVDNVLLELPRFMVSDGIENAEPVLAQLGIPRFTFSGLVIDTIVHKAVYRQNEEGAEFAAASGGVRATSMQRPNHLVADRPFFWILRDTRTGMILGGPSLVSAPKAP